jgi:hypothetical protein
VLAPKPLSEGCRQRLELLKPLPSSYFDFGWISPLNFPRYVSISAMVAIPTLELLALVDAKKQVPAFY